MLDYYNFNLNQLKKIYIEQFSESTRALTSVHKRKSRKTKVNSKRKAKTKTLRKKTKK